MKEIQSDNLQIKCFIVQRRQKLATILLCLFLMQ